MNSNVVGAVAELLEVTASGHSQLLGFQLDLILKSQARSAIYQLATVFNVPHDEVGGTVRRACRDLDRLERCRGTWRDPVAILKSPNLAALFCVCRARKNRVLKPAREQRLGKILRKVERAHQLAQTQAWIEAFIGPLPEKQGEGQIADN